MSMNEATRLRALNGIVCTEDRTKQSMKAECDINNILARYAKSGLLTHVAKGVPQYVDVSNVGDYRDAVEQVKRADEFFMGLPAKIRAKFENDAAVFLDFMTDPANEAEARELGLLPKAAAIDTPAVPASTQ